MTDITAQIL